MRSENECDAVESSSMSSAERVQVQVQKAEAGSCSVENGVEPKEGIGPERSDRYP